MKLRAYLTTSLLVATILTQSAAAQSPADVALERFRVEKIRLLENVLFKYTEKTARVIYAREMTTPLSKPAFCGEALLGSQRQKFLLDLNSGKMRVGVSQADWDSLDCRSAEGETLIDLR
jgi:hypothetical protein